MTLSYHDRVADLVFQEHPGAPLDRSRPRGPNACGIHREPVTFGCTAFQSVADHQVRYAQRPKIVLWHNADGLNDVIAVSAAYPVGIGCVLALADHDDVI